MRLETNHVETYPARAMPECYMGRYSIQGGRNESEYWIADETGTTLHRVPTSLEQAMRLTRIGNNIDGKPEHEAAWQFQDELRRLVQSQIRSA